MVLALYMQIDPKTGWVNIVFGIFVSVALVILFLFFLTSMQARETSQFAWDMGRSNLEKRITGNGRNQYEKSTSRKRMLLYLIYPKRKDLQKPLLIVLGFIYGFFFINRIPDLKFLPELMHRILDPMSLWKLVFTLLVFDFFAYQARYQINDIRGIEEDREAGKTDRLPLDACKSPEDAIQISWIVALIKIIISIFGTICFGGEIRLVLLICLGFLFILTVLYELARTKKWIKTIFFLVGTGYPLRFFVGFFLVVPLKSITISTVLICVALWAYGLFAAALPWTSEVIERMERGERNKSFPPSYRKKHFENIQERIMERYRLAKERCENGKILPLREKGSLLDPWNLALLICLAFLFAAVMFDELSVVVCIMELIFALVFFTNIFMSRQKKLIPMCIGWACMIGKVLLNLFLHKLSAWYLMLSLLQMIVTITYFILCYQPQLKSDDSI